MRTRYSLGTVEKTDKTDKTGKPVKKAAVYTQDEHGINFSDVDPEAVYIVKALRNQGYETYIVGGAVRDLILGKKPKDFDIVSAAIPARIRKLFRRARVIGHRFRLVHVPLGSKIFEVSTFRSLKDGLTSNTFGTIEEDVLRRDFTLNALFYDPLTQVVVDYVGGMRDIQRRNIRPIISLDTIFSDDPVRMIRAVKYAASTGFKLPLFLKWKMRKQSPLLTEVPSSRLTEEMFKIIQSPAAGQIVESLEAFGLYAYLQPQASLLMKEQGGFQARYLQSLKSLSQGNGTSLPGAGLAALIRDYVEDHSPQWTDDPEPYREIFAAARRFVLPINPPRAELERALRLLFKEHGIILKKPQLSERERRVPVKKPGAPKGAQENPGLSPNQDGAKPKKRRPRRRKQSAAEKPSEGFPETPPGESPPTSVF